jgi:GNAT superfamily N-acetyltransferase
MGNETKTTHDRRATLTRIVDPERIDSSEIERLLAQESPRSKPPSADDMRAALHNETFYLLVLRAESERYLGMGSMIFHKTLTRWNAEIHDVVVDERERGKGYGKTVMNGLLETALSFAKEHDTKIALSLTSKPSREAANKLYEKLGFERIAQSSGERGTNLYRLYVDANGYRTS